jgi:nucleoside-diphosphate-sugar epimerase
MKVAVTGATGNVGSAVVRSLVENGHEVVGVVRRVPEGAGWPWSELGWVRADLAEDCADALDEAFAGADAVVHLAWGFQPSHDLDYLEELGVGGTRRVLEAAGRNGVGHLVHQSSVGAYAPRRGHDPVDEGYPTTGVPGSPYSRHKSAAERLVDGFEDAHPDVVVTRMRPGIVAQQSAGSSQLRYFLPTIAPGLVLKLLPVLPLPDVTLPVVHADDVAEAIRLALVSRAPGAFNLAAEPTIGPAELAKALGAVRVPAPAPVVRAAVAAGWRLGVQPLDPGWIDLAANAPALDTRRARQHLGWTPAVDAHRALAELVHSLTSSGSGDTPVLRPRSAVDGLTRALADGTVARRRVP